MSDLFTSWPWGIEQCSEVLWVGPLRPDGMKVEQVVVCLNFDGDLTTASKVRQLANAQLIAAAPELLEALEGAMVILGWAESNASGNPDWDHVGPRVAAARAAIPKARGQA